VLFQNKKKYVKVLNATQNKRKLSWLALRVARLDHWQLFAGAKGNPEKMMWMIERNKETMKRPDDESFAVTGWIQGDSSIVQPPEKRLKVEPDESQKTEESQEEKNDQATKPTSDIPTDITDDDPAKVLPSSNQAAEHADADTSVGDSTNAMSQSMEANSEIQITVVAPDPDDNQA
jgi:hypothetical protein